MSVETKIVQADCIDAVMDMADGSVACVVTSPPFWAGTSYLPPGHPQRGSEIGAEGTVEEYASGMMAASRLLAEDAAAVWLFVLPNLVVTKTGITGVPANASSLSFDVTTIASA